MNKKLIILENEIKDWGIIKNIVEGTEIVSIPSSVKEFNELSTLIDQFVSDSQISDTEIEKIIPANIIDDACYIVDLNIDEAKDPNAVDVFKFFGRITRGSKKIHFNRIVFFTNFSPAVAKVRIPYEYQKSSIINKKHTDEIIKKLSEWYPSEEATLTKNGIMSEPSSASTYSKMRVRETIGKILLMSIYIGIFVFLLMPPIVFVVMGYKGIVGSTKNIILKLVEESFLLYLPSMVTFGMLIFYKQSISQYFDSEKQLPTTDFDQVLKLLEVTKKLFIGSLISYILVHSIEMLDHYVDSYGNSDSSAIVTALIFLGISLIVLMIYYLILSKRKKH